MWLLSAQAEPWGHKTKIIVNNVWTVLCGDTYYQDVVYTIESSVVLSFKTILFYKFKFEVENGVDSENIPMSVIKSENYDSVYY